MKAVLKSILTMLPQPQQCVSQAQCATAPWPSPLALPGALLVVQLFLWSCDPSGQDPTQAQCYKS